MTEQAKEIAHLFPSTHVQKAIWFIEQMGEGSPAYCIPFAYRIRGDLKTDAVKSAINLIINRHDAFRTQFREIQGEVKQIVHPSFEIDVPVTDFSDCEAEVAFSKAMELIQNLAKEPFDITQLPLIRAEVVILSDGDFALFLNIHHIIVDHLSVLQFAQEFSAAYTELLHDNSVKNDLAPLHISDYAVWQEENQTEEYFSKKIDYWTSTVVDPDSYLELPSNKSRPVLQTSRGEEYWFSLSEEASSGMRALSKKENLSMFVAMMSAYAALMHRYSADDFITLGSPFANRGDQEELERVMGCFINTLPIVIDFSDRPNFLTLMQRVKAATLGAFSNQDVPFDQIVKALKPKRQSSYSAVVQHCFMLQDPPMELDLPGLETENLHLHSKTAKFDILAWLWEADTIQGLFEYNVDVFDETTIKALVQNFDALLVDLCRNPERAIGEYSLLSPLDKDVLASANATKVSRNFQPVHQYLVDHAKKNREKIAYQDSENEISLEELNNRVSQLASYLLDLGVQPGDYVGISINRSIEMVVGLLGILKSGAAYVPLDPEYPEDRLAYMVINSEIKLVLTEEELIENLTVENVKFVALDTAKKEISSTNIKSDFPKVTPESIAYVIYTSGSTGKPKGVMVPHRAMQNFLLAMQERLSLTESERFLAITTMSFDISVLEVFLPIVLGANCTVVDKEISTDAEKLNETLERFSISVMQATPATWRLLLSSSWAGNNQLKALCGGEALPQDLAKDLVPQVGELWNMYGPTETTVWSTCYHVKDPEISGVVGTPIANTQIYVVDTNDQLQPCGVAGELLIGGEGVTHGYLNRQDLTDKQFVSMPHLAEGLLYKTGDKVALQHDGNIRYFNRLDNQVKIRGFRIELGEIENCLLSMKEIDQGATVVQGQGVEKKLVAFFKSHDGEKVGVMKIRKHLSEHLPKYMIPSQFVELESLPLTPAGKINRKELSAKSVESHNTGITAEFLPKSNSEKYHANVWRQFLKIDAVGINDNFFDLGGHSLMALQIMDYVKKDQNIAMPARSLMISSLGQLAQAYVVDVPIETGENASRSPGHEDSSNSGQAEPGEDKSKKHGFLQKIFGRGK